MIAFTAPFCREHHLDAQIASDFKIQLASDFVSKLVAMCRLPRIFRLRASDKRARSRSNTGLNQHAEAGAATERISDFLPDLPSNRSVFAPSGRIVEDTAVAGKR